MPIWGGGAGARGGAAGEGLGRGAGGAWQGGLCRGEGDVCQWLTDCALRTWPQAAAAARLQLGLQLLQLPAAAAAAAAAVASYLLNTRRRLSPPPPPTPQHLARGVHAEEALLLAKRHHGGCLAHRLSVEQHVDATAGCGFGGG
jgi:hypothetical protein